MRNVLEVKQADGAERKEWLRKLLYKDISGLQSKAVFEAMEDTQLAAPHPVIAGA